MHVLVRFVWRTGSSSGGAPAAASPAGPASSLQQADQGGGAGATAHLPDGAGGAAEGGREAADGGSAAEGGEEDNGRGEQDEGEEGEKGEEEEMFVDVFHRGLEMDRCVGWGRVGLQGVGWGEVGWGGAGVASVACLLISNPHEGGGEQQGVPAYLGVWTGELSATLVGVAAVCEREDLSWPSPSTSCRARRVQAGGPASRGSLPSATAACRWYPQRAPTLGWPPLPPPPALPCRDRRADLHTFLQSMGLPGVQPELLRPMTPRQVYARMARNLLHIHRWDGPRVWGGGGAVWRTEAWPGGREGVAGVPPWCACCLEGQGRCAWCLEGQGRQCLAPASAGGTDHGMPRDARRTCACLPAYPAGAVPCGRPDCSERGDGPLYKSVALLMQALTTPGTGVCPLPWPACLARAASPTWWTLQTGHS